MIVQIWVKLVLAFGHRSPFVYLKGSQTDHQFGRSRSLFCHAPSVLEERSAVLKMPEPPPETGLLRTSGRRIFVEIVFSFLQSRTKPCGFLIPGLDPPFFSTIVLFTSCFPRVLGGVLERRMPGNNG